MPTPQEFHQTWLFFGAVNVLFPDRVSAAIADSAFPDNARVMRALQVTAIDFSEFMCFYVTISFILLYL